ncbi:MAG: fibronectin type III domain-containing protein [Cyclobacteriaceae bacterium]
MKHLRLLFFLLWFGWPLSQAVGQNWNEGTTINSLVDFNGVHFPSDQIGYAAGTGGTIYKSTDGGLNWSAQTSNTTNALQDIYFINTTTGFAVGASGTIRKTTDGGTTWSTQTAAGTSTTTFYEVQFLDANNGYVVGSGGKMIKTSNGGTTWTSVTSGTTNDIAGLHFTSATTGYFVSTAGLIRKTTNSGTSFSTLTIASTANFTDIVFVDANTGFVTGTGGELWKTTNAGTNWTAKNSGMGSLDLNAVAFADALNGTATSSGGYHYVTIDGGDNWIGYQIPGFATLQDVMYSSLPTGYMVGTSGTFAKYQSELEPQAQPSALTFDEVYASSFRVAFTGSPDLPTGYIAVRKAGSLPTTDPVDGITYTEGQTLGDGTVAFVGTATGFEQTGLTPGTTYYLKVYAYNGSGTAINYRPTSPLSGSRATYTAGTPWTTNYTQGFTFPQAVHFYDASTGGVSGGYNLQSTSDGGTTWLNGFSGNGDSYNGIFFISPTVGFVAGQGNGSIRVIRRTVNGGATWVDQMRTTSTWAFNDIWLTSSTAGVAVGGSGNIYRTVNGINWSSVSSGVLMNLNAVHFPTSSFGVAVGASGTITRTSDGGATWSPVAGPTLNTLYDVFFTSAITGFAVGGSGTILKSTNGGSSWSAVTSGVAADLRSVWFTDANTGYIVGMSGTILKSTDGGTSWYPFATGADNTTDYYGVQFPTPYTGYVAGSGGTLGRILKYQTVPEPTGQPSGLVISGITSSGLTMSFSASPTPVDGYIVLRKADGSPTSAPYDGQSYVTGSAVGDAVVAYVGSNLSFTDSGLSPGTSYFYTIFSQNRSADDASSNYLRTAPLAGSATTLLNAPTPSTATQVATTSFTANWSSVAGITGYELDVSADNFASFVAGFNGYSTGSNSVSVTGLTAGVNYSYRVRAINPTGASLNSAVTNVLTLPGAPVAAPASLISTSGITANWSASNSATGYYFDLSTNNFSTFVAGYNNLPVSGTSVTINGLSAGTSYQYRVRAINASGTSANSSTISTITLTLAPATSAATAVSAAGFTANWSAVTGAADYRVDVASDPSFNFMVGSYSNQTAAGTSLGVTGLLPGTNYYYRVRGSNASGSSSNSSPISVLTLPAAPTSNDAASVGSAAFGASWNAVPTASSYLLDVSLAADFSSFVAGYNALSVALNATTVTVPTEGLTYYYRVRAVNATGNSGYSNTVTTLLKPATPVASAAANVTGSSFDAAWPAASGADGYTIEVSSDNFVSNIPGYDNLTVTGTSLTVTGLNEGTTYKYRLRATNASWTSANSNTITLTTIPPAPLALTAGSISTSAFTAKWAATSGASGYLLDVSADDFTTFEPGYQDAVVTGTSKVITGLTSGKTYQYRLRATNTAGTSGYSNSIAVSVLANAPLANTAISISASGFVARWLPVSGATDYRIDVSQSAGFSTFEGLYNNLPVNGTSVSITGLSAGNTYYYRVRANNASGASVNSNVIAVLLKPAAPDVLAGSDMTTNAFTANWNAQAGITDFAIDVSVNDFISNLSGYDNLLVNGNTVAVSGLNPGTTYKYRVRAINATGASDNSLAMAVITVPPAPVASPATQVTTAGFTANWNTSSGVPAYYLDVSDDISFGTFLTGYQNFASSSSSQTISGLPAGTTWYYRVRGANVSGTSTDSNVITVATLPTAPNATAATAVSASGFTANWDAVPGVSSYRVDVSTDPNFSFFVGSYFNQLVAGNSLTVTGLSAGTQYFYRVRSENGSGNSTNSVAVNVLTWPSAPVANESLSVTSLTFLANWNSVSTATGYYIDVSASSNFSSMIAGFDNLLVSGTSASVTVPGEGTTYYYRVRAENTSGLSASSNTVATLMRPAPPVVNAASGVGTNSFGASWFASPGATGYYLDVSNNNFASFITPYENFLLAGTTLTVNGLNPGTSYQFRVRSYNATGASLNSSVVNVTTVPPPPVTISATGFTATSFVANWQATPGANSYELDVSDDPAFSTFVANFQAAPAAGISATVDNLNPGTVYYYRVRAVNAFGISANSNVTSSTNIPPAPTGLTVSGVSTGGFSLTWLSTPGAFSYELDISADNFATYAAVYNSLSVTGTSLNVSGLSAGTSYQIRLRASNASGTSANSSITTAETLPDEPASQPASLLFTSITTTGYTMSYAPSSGGATGYLVLRRVGTAPAEVPADGTAYNAGTVLGSSRVSYAGSATTLNETGLTPGTTYYYAVYAYAGSGSKANYLTANPLAGFTITIPDAPVLSVASAIGQHGFTANWSSVTGASGYALDVSSDNFASLVTGYEGALTGDVNTFPITGLGGGIVYQYRLRAVNASGTSSPSASQSQLTSPENPVNLSTSDVTSSGFTVTWDIVTGADNYLVDVSTDTNFSVLTVNDASTTTPAITLTGLTNATTYFVRVRASNSAGSSLDAVAVSAKTLSGAGGPGLPVVGSPQFTGPLKSSPVTVTVAVTGGADPKTVELFYRGIAGTNFKSIAATLKSGNTFEASLTPAMADTLGIEFFVKATDADNQTDESDAHSYLYRAIDASSNTAIPFVADGFKGTAATYQMFSVPYEMSDNSIANLFEPALVGYSNTRWRLLHYDNGTLAEYPEQLKKIELGNGYWFNTIVKDFSIKLADAQVKAVTPSSPFSMTLKQGWNQIGDPYPFNVDWNAIVAANPDAGLNALWLFEDGNYAKKDVLAAWKGAFVFSDNGGTLTFPLSARTNAGGRLVTHTPSLSDGEWMLPVTVLTGDVHTVFTTGMRTDASHGKDPYDEIALPRFLQYVEVSTQHPEFFAPSFAGDIVPVAQSHTWTFYAESNVEATSSFMTWDPSTIAHLDGDVLLYDVTSQVVVDMKRIGIYSYKPANGQTFKVIRSQGMDLPEALTELTRAYPNPFVNAIRVPVWTETADSHVKLEIFNSMGQPVHTVQENFVAPGLHEVQWNSEMRPDDIPSGLLFYRMQVNGQKTVLRRLIKVN